MEQFFSFILGTIIFFYLLGIVGKWLLRFWLERKIKQMQNGQGGSKGNFYYKSWGGNAGRASGGFNSNTSGSRSSKNEGDVTISKNGADTKRVNSKVGDYVDFEEVD